MAQAFTRHPDDDARIVGFLDDVERSVVIELLYQTSVLLSDGSDDDGDPADVASASAGEKPSDEDALFASLSRSMSEREAPTDPALRRLLPDATKTDDAAAAEFRRLTEATLRERKLANLETAMRCFEAGFVDDEQAAALADAEYDRATASRTHGAPQDDAQENRAQADDGSADGLSDGSREVVLTEAQARATMMALTDVRLVLAERLGLHTDEDADALNARLEAGEAPESAEELLAAYYDFLTWMSESITLAVMRKS